MFKKFLIIFINFILLLSIIYTSHFYCMAFDVSTTFGGELSKVENAKTATTEIIGTVLSIIRIAAAGVAVVILMVIGCKYMLASAGDRADIKKYAINYVIGAFILFGATALVSIAKVFIDSSFN